VAFVAPVAGQTYKLRRDKGMGQANCQLSATRLAP
jgi:hypothetical protein